MMDDIDDFLSAVPKLTDKSNYQLWARLFKGFLHLKRKSYVLTQPKPVEVSLERDANGEITNQKEHDDSLNIIRDWNLMILT